MIISKARRLLFFLFFCCVILMMSFYVIIRNSNTSSRLRQIECDNFEVVKTLKPNEGNVKNMATEPQILVTDPPPKEPKSNLYFMKTHKTGSSTLQNILVRYAWNKNLLVGLPLGDILFRSYYGGKKFVKSEIQPLPAGTKPNMILHHMVFNYEQVAATLPSDSLYFTILRDPATLFESVFKYFVQVKAFQQAKSDGGLTAFLDNPDKYFHGPADGQYRWFAKNGVSFDLGFDNLNETDKYINETIEKMEKTFDLVLIMEHFDASLVLLRDLLGWDMNDMVYLTMNQRKSSTVEHVANEAKAKIYSWNKADTALYDHFNKTFWKRVEQYGKTRMERDLKELDKVKKEIASYCVEDDPLSNSNVSDPSLKMFNPKGIEVTQYRLKEHAKTNETCRGLILPEVQWWKRMSARQRPRVSPVKQKTAVGRPV